MNILQLNPLTAVFNARLAQANLVTKTDFNAIFTAKLPQIKQNFSLLKMILKS